MEFKNIKKAHTKTYEIFAMHWKSPNQIELELFYECLLYTSFKQNGLNINELQTHWDGLVNYTPVQEYKQELSELRKNRFEYYDCYSSIYELDFFKEKIMWVGKDVSPFFIPLGEEAYATKEEHKIAMEFYKIMIEISFNIHKVIEGKYNQLIRFKNRDYSPFRATHFIETCMLVHKEHNIILKPAFGLKRAFNWYISIGED